VTIGTRAAAFAPVAELGLIICTDDANRNYLDQHAPYPHAREVSLLRSTIEDTELLFVSTDRSAEVQRLVETGWLADITPTGAARRPRSSVHMRSGIPLPGSGSPAVPGRSCAPDCGRAPATEAYRARSSPKCPDPGTIRSSPAPGARRSLAPPAARPH